MTHHAPDMDHDGEITGKDAGIFHEMMDEDARRYRSRCPSGKGSRYKFKESCIRLLIAFVLSVFPGKVLDGTIPINAVTVILGVIVLIIALLMILDVFGIDP